MRKISLLLAVGCACVLVTGCGGAKVEANEKVIEETTVEMNEIEESKQEIEVKKIEKDHTDLIENMPDVFEMFPDNNISIRSDEYDDYYRVMINEIESRESYDILRDAVKDMGYKNVRYEVEDGTGSSIVFEAIDLDNEYMIDISYRVNDVNSFILLTISEVNE